jgi:hypothetical protein|tara:strand:- start:472 stop:849 length:378 start_codon:yes stop_codon:yes gene_type:complete
MRKRCPFKELMCRVRSSAKTAKEKGQMYGRIEPWDIDIDSEYLKEIYEKNNGYCPYHLAIGIYKNIDLDLVFVSYNMLSPSVDRIDSTKGYIKGNVVITHRITNLGKQKTSFDEFLNQLRIFNNK